MIESGWTSSPRDHRDRLVPPADDVRRAAELQVDAFDEGRVQRQHQLLVAVHADHADPAAGASHVDAVQEHLHDADTLEHRVSAPAHRCGPG